MGRELMRAGVLACVLAIAGCATLQNVLTPPRISAADGMQAELRLIGPSSSRPLGGASIRLYARVENPNPFGLTLTQLAGNLFLEDTRAAEVSFPLGLPLVAGQDTIVPLDISLSFTDLPGLADVAQRVLLQQRVGYRMDGTFGVDAGPLGQPTFGPSTLMRGDVVVRR